MSVVGNHKKIKRIRCLFVVLIDEEEGRETVIVVRIEEGQFFGQGDEVAASFVEGAIEASEVPKAVLRLVGLFSFDAHPAAFFAESLKMAALRLVPAVHLIAHGFHLLG